jgi:hypothetical protein
MYVKKIILTYEGKLKNYLRTFLETIYLVSPSGPFLGFVITK